MTCAVSLYKKRLRQSLPCSRKTRQSLMTSFEKLLQPYLEENGTPDMAQLTADFGPPERMASTMLEGVSVQERLRYKRRRTFCFLLFGMAALLLLAQLLFFAYVRGKEAGESEEEFTEVTVLQEDGGSQTFSVPRDGKLLIRPDGSAVPLGPAEALQEETQ